MRRWSSTIATARPLNARGRAFSSLLHPVQGFYVDIGGAKDGDEQNDRQGRRIARAPFLERLALQGDRRNFRGRSRTARGKQVDHVEHLEVLDGPEKNGEHQ